MALRHQPDRRRLTGLVNFTNGLLLCSVVSGIEMVLYLRASTDSPVAVTVMAPVPASISSERVRQAHAA